MQLLTNSFQLPQDGWYQISALGEFPHNPTGLTQIVDETSCRSMVDSFHTASQQPNFAGLLIDFDHFSLERDKPSEAAGWISSLEQRPDGLWAQIRWSDSGQQAVTGGRYRFISPVWKQDECEMLGNNRVRPTRLVNAAVTNDPNIRGMIPLSNRAEPVRVNSRPFAVTNRQATCLARAVVFIETGVHIPPPPSHLQNAAPMSDAQRRAMFARLHDGGGGPRGASGAGGDAGATGSAQNEPSPSPDYQNPASVQYDPIRASTERVQAIEAQRDALITQRPIEPKQPDFSITDTRQLARDMMKQGKSTNEISAAVKAADAQNTQRKDALEKIKHDIRKAYPNDKAKQAQALSKYKQALDAQYQKQHDQWSKVNDQIDALVAKADQMIAEEKARGIEEAKLADQKTRNAAAVREQKLTDAQTREQQRQAAADKAAAQRKDAADEKAQRDAEKKTVSPDTVAAMSKEMKRRQFYWQSLARGETDTARMLYPNADTDGNLKTLTELAPPSKSKSNSKAHKAVLAELEKEAP